MYNSTVNMFKSSKIYAYGFASLNGIKLYCQKNQVCEIECRD